VEKDPLVYPLLGSGKVRVRSLWERALSNPNGERMVQIQTGKYDAKTAVSIPNGVDLTIAEADTFVKREFC
jgi:hypothetical protein